MLLSPLASSTLAILNILKVSLAVFLILKQDLMQTRCSEHFVILQNHENILIISQTEANCNNLVKSELKNYLPKSAGPSSAKLCKTNCLI